jgi:hypothetical protein
MTHDNAPDDIDRLLGRLQPAPVPTELTQRVLARTTERPSILPWIVAGAGAVLLLAVSGYQVGANLATTDGLDLLDAVASDAGLLTSAPGIVLAAMAELVPWWLLVLAAASLACVTWIVGRVVPRPA